jgi:hypothetical protein
MVENLVDDGVEEKSSIIEAHVDVKPSIEDSIYVKPSIEASFESKPTGVSNLRDNEVNIASFFSLRIDGECEMICLIGFIDKR